MKKNKKLFAVALTLCIFLSGCGGSLSSPQSKRDSEPVSSENSVSQTSSGNESKPEIQTAVLYTNMDGGSESSHVKEHSYEYSGELTAETLAEGLSQLTGLDFTITASNQDDGIAIDWANKSTLIANLDDRVQKEEFFLYDCDSMRWFMMDSLWMTLTANLGVDNVYYTMNGGQDLVFEELYPVKDFPADIPYVGCAFYFSHVDVKGDETIDTDTAMMLVQNAMDARGESASVVVQTGEETIQGEYALTFAAGDYSEDGQKFTAMYHYAVTDSGQVYYIDVLQGADWILFDMQAVG